MTQPLDTRPKVSVSYEYATNLPTLLQQLNLSVLISTYQAGRVVCVSSYQNKLQTGFSFFDHAMGMARTAKGIVIGSRSSIWNLPANSNIASRINPVGEHDVAFLARSSHHTGPVMGHDLAWGNNRLWLVNTLFNGLVTIEGDYNFVPQWLPCFIDGWTPSDRCHLNGLAMAEDGTAPAYVTALGETATDKGWREHKATGGCLIDVATNAVIMRGLSMPHSPRLYQGQLYLLNSGHGSLLLVDRATGQHCIIASLPGFTRGMDCFAGYAFVGLSLIRETATFGGLPISEHLDRKCGLAIVHLATGRLESMLWFNSGVEEIYDVTILPGCRNPAIIGPDTALDDIQTIWLVPSS